MKSKIKISIKTLLMLSVAMIATGIANAQKEVAEMESGPLVLQAQEQPCITHENYAKMNSEIKSNQARLRQEGKLINAQAKALPPQKFDWPLTYETSFLGNDYFFIQNYVDHDNASGSISEYMCGTRSYDLPSGYDHQGTDICIGPYWWNMMDDMKVRIIAAAPGQIVSRNDGNNDRNCGFGGGTANSVTVQHSDGTFALYWHMKSGSVTAKTVGDFVEKGEFLGYVGSSGSSTNPHLHFEVQDSLGNVIDPWQGPCNPDIFQSLWNDQKPYPNSGIMSILTMTGPPTIPACPNPETVPYSNHFAPGDTVRIEAHLRDLIPNTTCTIRVYNPANSLFKIAYGNINNFSAGNWFAYNVILANNAAVGTYKVQVTYQSKVAAHYFTVGCPGSYNLSGAITGLKGYLSGADITSTQTIAGSGSNNIWYESESFIKADVGFQATQGCHFRARIDACAQNSLRTLSTDDEIRRISLQANPSIVTNKTTLQLDMNQTGLLTVSVFDLTGRKIKSVIANQSTFEGTHEFELSTEGISSGVYICTAEMHELKASCRIIVQK